MHLKDADGAPEGVAFKTGGPSNGREKDLAGTSAVLNDAPARPSGADRSLSALPHTTVVEVVCRQERLESDRR